MASTGTRTFGNGVYQAHWAENVVTGQRVESKLKLVDVLPRQSGAHAVRCIDTLPNEFQAQRLRPAYRPGKQVFGVVIGQEYVVFGLRVLGGEVWLELNVEFDLLYSVPLALFEIIDGSIPSLWEARTNDSAEPILWPPSFFGEYYHDDLAERSEPVLEDFRRIRKILQRHDGAIDSLSSDDRIHFLIT